LYALVPADSGDDAAYLVRRGRRLWIEPCAQGGGGNGVAVARAGAYVAAKMRAPHETEPLRALQLRARGLGEAEAAAAAARFGPNRYALPKPSFLALLGEQLQAPLFVFQLFCVALWMLDEYWYFSLVTLAMLVVMEAGVAGSRLANLARLRAIDVSERDVAVLRDGRWEARGSYALVPGDVVALAHRRSEPVPCPADLLLLAGSAVVNEAMLTGESTPVLKEAANMDEGELDAPIRLAACPGSVLRAGTSIVQTGAAADAASVGPPQRAAAPLYPRPPDGSVVAYVLQTGFGTDQGALMRTIVDATDHVTVNSREAYVFLAGLLAVGMCASAYVWHTVASTDPDASRYKLLLHCIIIVTSVVPPELPVELTMAVNASILALQTVGVFCTQPFRIPYAGRVDLCCFDKTGTLTENHIVLEGLCGRGDDDAVTLRSAHEFPVPDAVIAAAACQSLALMDGKMIGDPTEIAMFEGIGFEVRHDGSVGYAGKPPSRPLEVRRTRLLRRFAFSGERKRMSTLVAVDGRGAAPEVWVVCKGAPESIRPLLTSVPVGFDSTADFYARRGRRVLAVASRPMPGMRASDRMPSSYKEVERDLVFGCFLVFRTVPKPDSAATIAHLRQSLHDVVMITGDHLLTAAQIAVELGIAGRLATMQLPPPGSPDARTCIVDMLTARARCRGRSAVGGGATACTHR
jgi:cation-transporting ATPase 13A1